MSLLVVSGKDKTKGLQSGVDIGVKYSKKQGRNFDDATMKAGQCVVRLQMDTNKGASHSGMTAYGSRRLSMPPRTTSCLLWTTAPSASRWAFISVPAIIAGHREVQQLFHVPADGVHAWRQPEWPGLWTGAEDINPKYCPRGSAADRAPTGGNGQGEAPEYLSYCQEEASY